MGEVQIIQRHLWKRFFTVRPRPELKEFYWFSALFWLAASLVTVFEPVFFYSIDIPISLIAVYYALHYAAYLVLLPLAGKFMSRFGLERSLTFAAPILMGYLLLLSAVPSWPGLFWLAWAALAVFKIFFWPAHYAMFARFSQKSDRGTEVSFGLVIEYLAGIVGPFLGGVIATVFGFPVLFITAAGAALVSSVPLLKTREQFTIRSFSYSAPWRIIRSVLHRKLILSTTAWGEHLVMMVFWPMFAFSVLGSAAVLGTIVSLSVLFVAVFSLVVGELSDHYTERRVARWALPFMILGHLVRPLAATPWGVWLVHTFTQTADAGVRIPFWSRLFGAARRSGSIKYVIAFEMWLCVIKALTAFGLAVVFATLAPTQAFTVTFVVAALFSLFYFFM